MSRSGYSDDCDGWSLIRWRGAVKSAIRGARGQAFLRELVACLDAMPDKELITNHLVSNGKYCALGVVGRSRGMALLELNPDDRVLVAEKFGIAEALAAEIEFENDEGGYWPHETPATRWQRMREWAAGNLKPETEQKK